MKKVLAVILVVFSIFLGACDTRQTSSNPDLAPYVAETDQTITHKYFVCSNAVDNGEMDKLVSKLRKENKWFDISIASPGYSCWILVMFER